MSSLPPEAEKAVRKRFIKRRKFPPPSAAKTKADAKVIKNFPTLINQLIERLIYDADYRNIAVGLSIIFISIATIISANSDWTRLAVGSLAVVMLVLWNKKLKKNNRTTKD